jgi:hypothetical protein
LLAQLPNPQCCSILLSTKADMRLPCRCGFFFGAFSVVATIWCYFRLPETKGRTFEELDHMFEAGIPARKFSEYKISEGREITV